MRFIDFDSTGRRTGKGQKKKIRFRVPHAHQTASAPTLSFGDGDTGIWEPQDDVLQFGTAGNQKLEINASGQVGIGGITPIYDLHVGSASGGHYFQRYASDASPPTLCLDKSRHDTIGSHTIVADNDVLGAIIFKGSDGSAFRNAAVIRCDVDGTPGSSDMPGELLFQVTPDGSATAATAMTISPDKTVTLAGNLVVSGTTTTIDSTTLTVDDKNIELGSVASPSDTTADGGGITLKGATDKTIVWTDSQDAWVYNQGITVGVDDTGHDVKFFGATAGKSWLWDESADKMIITGDTQLTGALTVGVDDTGHDVKFFGATAGKYMEWDESADQLDVTGSLDVTGNATLTGSIAVDDIIEKTSTHGVEIDGVVLKDGGGTFTENIGITKSNDGGDVELSINNSAGSGSTDETVTIKAGQAGTVGGKIVFARHGDYNATGDKASTLNFYTADDNSDQLRMHISKGGNVGIGAASPSSKLHVDFGAGGYQRVEYDAGGYSGLEFHEAGTNRAYFDWDDGNNRFTWYAGGGGSSDIKMVLLENGNVGIANTAPADKLWVQGGISATGDITSSASDKRLKENRKPISNAVEKVLKLKGITYDWIDNISEVTGTEWNHTEKQAGLIAQDVQKVLPEAVSIAPFDKDGEGKSVSGKDYLTIDYARVVPLLVNAIKEQQVQIEELKKEIKE